ncbi:N-formylglutamate amidohydrolase [Gammaproteobacteria bacterium]|nr:N-formylglutamate amidohydrolase [Gammaproteobacteria bacterium]
MERTDKSAKVDDEHHVSLTNPQGRSSLVIVCEHASNHVPASFHNLGLPSQTLEGQLAYDFGALGLAEQLQRFFDAALVAADTSRLVCDVSRPPASSQAIPDRSHGRFIPGNYALSRSARSARLAEYHQPFERSVAVVLERRQFEGIAPVLLSVHSFIPRIGEDDDDTALLIIHDQDARLARHLEARVMGGEMAFRRLDLSGQEVTWTLRQHAISRHFFNLRIAMRADLLNGHRQQNEAAQWLGPRIAAAIDDCHTGNPRGEDH